MLDSRGGKKRADVPNRQRRETLSIGGKRIHAYCDTEGGRSPSSRERGVRAAAMEEEDAYTSSSGGFREKRKLDGRHFQEKRPQRTRGKESPLSDAVEGRRQCIDDCDYRSCPWKGSVSKKAKRKKNADPAPPERLLLATRTGGGGKKLFPVLKRRGERGSVTTVGLRIG